MLMCDYLIKKNNQLSIDRKIVKIKARRFLHLDKIAINTG